MKTIMKRALIFVALIASLLLFSSCQTAIQEVPVSSVTLNPSSIEMSIVEITQLTAEVTPSNATIGEIVWSSSVPTVAGVNNNGVVTALSEGTSAVIVTIGGKTGVCMVTVKSNLEAITIGADHISPISVVLKGKAILSAGASSESMLAIQYSLSAGFPSSATYLFPADEADANKNYSKTINWLEPETTYYYRSVVRHNGKEAYGETKEFTTKKISALIETDDASEVSTETATLWGNVDLTDVSFGFKDITYGFSWGTSETSQTKTLKGGNLSNKTYSAAMTGLSHMTQYWYKAFINLDGRTLYGEVKSFTTGGIPAESVSLDKSEYSFYSLGGTLTLKATILPENASIKSVDWASENNSVATVDSYGRVTAKGKGITTITASTKDGTGITASCSIRVMKQSCPSGAIDLGLSVYWSSCNMNVYKSFTQVERYGDYYAWGETDTHYKDGFAQSKSWVMKNAKTGYDLANYRWYDGHYYTKYVTPGAWGFDYGNVDNRTVLETGSNGDDIASKQLGGSWRIPTADEWQELIDKCTWTWTSYNGVNGYRITGPNGSNIFLPAAGDRTMQNLNNVGTQGRYWSSTLYTDACDSAYYLDILQVQYALSTYQRPWGLSVRPVSD